MREINVFPILSILFIACSILRGTVLANPDKELASSLLPEQVIIGDGEYN